MEQTVRALARPYLSYEYEMCTTSMYEYIYTSAANQHVWTLLILSQAVEMMDSNIHIFLLEEYYIIRHWSEKSKMIRFFSQ